MRVAALSKLIGLSVVLVTPLGCAPQYHCYRGCYVDCQYCQPAPLPYQLYDECACHSCVAEMYLAKESTAREALASPRTDESFPSVH